MKTAFFLLFCLSLRVEALDRLTLAQAGCGHAPTARQQIERTWTGRIKRSHAETSRFKKLTGWPDGRPGFQIDHIVPLKRGGVDCRCNVQWLSLQVKRVKDRVE